MITKIKSFSLVLFSAVALLAGCEKKEYSFGDFKTPADLTLTATVAGVDASNPNGNGTGNVVITATAKNAITYNIDFGDGKTQTVPSGTINYKYNNPGTADYTITVNAVGTGGVVSTISKKIRVFVQFVIPQEIIIGLTGGTSKVWVTAKDEPGHFGVGAPDFFFPNYYAATPNQRDPCVYDDEITFTKDATDNILMTVDNKGQSFSIGASTAFYGFGGGDACLNIPLTGSRKLVFMDATSASTPAISTRIQFDVPGNGLINFGTGATTYEILSITNGILHLRNIGSDGNSWYQKLKVK
ncbi:PKD domain-containing protein [Lacibacter sp. H407]|uniref:PKD domain-containing protein n=1 Tax=Lacibacter sp. H407 TaxID=3133423 RepID=UPI0030BD41D9